jgi:hypothetical protein
MCHAEQFVLFDVTFPFTKADADNAKPSPSHYYVKSDRLNPERRRTGTAPVGLSKWNGASRLEVIEKPAGSEATTWSVCYIRTGTAARLRLPGNAGLQSKRACTRRTSR